MLSKRTVTPIHVTVATAGRLRGLSLAEELRLVKAALLYADQVTLASLGAASLAAARDLLSGSDERRARRMLEVATVLMEPEYQRSMQILRSRRARRAIPGYRQFEASLTPYVQEIEAVVEVLRVEAGADELDAAVKAGILRIEPLGLDPVAFIQESVLLAKHREDGTRRPQPGLAETESGVPAIRALLQIIGRTLSPASDTYPLFDTEAAEIVREMIGTQPGMPASRLPAAQSGLAAAFVGTLPAFPDATIAEIVDVRRAVEPALVQFRAAVAGMAMEVREAAWDPGFDHEARALFTRTVEPALENVRDGLRAAAALSVAGHVVLSPSPYAAGGGAIAIALASASILPDLAAAALSIGAPVATGLAAAAEVIKEGYRRQKLVKSNQFLWLHQVARKLDS